MITLEERKGFIDKIIKAINSELFNVNAYTDLSDIGNLIGVAVGSITCENGKDKNIQAFEKYDFILGFEHGYSLKDGSH